MTREEMDFIGAMNMCDEISNEAYKKIMCHCEQTEPCEDAISRQAALDTFGLSEKTRKYGGDHSGYDTIMLYEVQDAIEALPSVTAERKGKWIPRFDDWGSNVKTLRGYKCSNCNGEHTDTITGKWHELIECKYPYCPNCGAKMEVE